MTHRGEILLKIVRQKGWKIGDFAEAMDVHRQTVYTWEKKDDVPANVLMRAGEVLGVDFFKIIPELKAEVVDMPYITGEEKVDTSKVDTLQDPTSGYEKNTVDRVDVMIHLDGTEETLDRLIRKLVNINRALRYG